MPTFQYNISTSNGSAQGQIEAADQETAEKKLTEQYAPKDHGFVTQNGKKKTHEVTDISLQEVTVR